MERCPKTGEFQSTRSALSSRGPRSSWAEGPLYSLAASKTSRSVPSRRTQSDNSSQPHPQAIIYRVLCANEEHLSRTTRSPSSMKTLLTPGICLLAVAALLHTGVLAPGAAVVSYAFYGAWIAG